MDSLEYNIYKKRNDRRRKRNIARRVSLIGFIIIFSFVLYQIYLIPVRNPISINLELNKLVNTEFIINRINAYVQSKNFFLIAPNEISKQVTDECNLLKKIVIRKYIFPTVSLRAYVVEKNVLGKIRFKNSGDIVKSEHYLTDEGNLVDPKFIVEDKIESALIPVTAVSGNSVALLDLKLLMQALKKISDNYGLIINDAQINYDGELKVLCDKDLKIIVGKIGEEILKRVARLKDVMEIVHRRDYLVDYIDLTLDNSVVFKKQIKNSIQKK